MVSSQLTQRIPPDSWDSHMHIVDVENYALDPSATYRPTSHSLEQALTFETSVGLRNIVLVQPSIYGLNNSCLLDGLRELGTERGRGVVAIDPEAFDAQELRTWHDLGVRGVRLNLQSTGVELDADQLERQLMLYADAVRPLGWVVQVYVPMKLITLLESIVPKLKVKFCIDHLGQPPLKDYQGVAPYDIPGFSSLIRLLKNGHTYVKLSAPYRMSALPDNSDVDPVAKEVIRVAGNSQVVFATDWPHTRFEGLDIKPWMERVLGWCGEDEHLIERLFKGNAEDLWDAKRSSRAQQ
ncbi:related to TIM barrel metal-dependent hydrolase [Fusarium torulosum]|uniref:Related to TIM barrel metal-dependent hydrolase n=1 Tax=Fusarium torulosum TaxID=33205 RepID=A0AAE8SD60_9HYPO|nr:related to TIM barrel metal-dependent hydrolase [Fusarium torulosum]